MGVGASVTTGVGAAVGSASCASGIFGKAVLPHAEKSNIKTPANIRFQSP